MNIIISNRLRAALLGLFLTISAHAHPGPAGHYHPDEVDEFDQLVVASPAVNNEHEYNLGGILVLLGIGACLSFAFFQKEGGIWKDVTAHH